mmetsp:Transcript_66075/g.166608  ORF Transcript_66075/g.166608 Transcript_66075/m.166608 type:complete len:552 (+) Transcript_66075:68-1723(+)
MPPKATPEVEMPGPQPWDVPAGGLDVPTIKPPAADEEEAFPGESQLSPDERKRWLILHFALPRTIMTCDMAEGRSTEAELNDVLSSMAWGSIDHETSEWMLESENPTLDPPHASLISYSEYVERTYPTDPTMEEDAREENARMAAQKREAFTNAGEPGVKFRPMFDQMVKNLAHSNKALMKAYELKKPILNEEDVPEDPSRSEQHAIMRFGRHQILPGFWQLLTQLTKKNRRFSLVFRTFSEEQLAVVQRELQLFCQGQHPAYDGKNKTQKPPPMSGDKGSRDMRLIDACLGRIDRFAGKLEFSSRPAGDAPQTARPGVQASAVPLAEAAGEEDASAAPAAFQPTVYEFPDYHTFYAGLQHQVLDGANTCAIVDDLKYWKDNDQDPSAGKLLLVDHGGGLAETKVQHVFFDGHISASSARCVDVRDVVSGDSIAHSEAEGIFTHRVDFFQASTDTDYFTQALEACERNFSQKILEARKAPGPGGEDAAQDASGAGSSADKLPHKEYLYRNVIPALLPALEACQRDRPADPIEFIAFYMLRHSKQYSKTLKA